METTNKGFLNAIGQIRDEMGECIKRVSVLAVNFYFYTKFNPFKKK